LLRAEVVEDGGPGHAGGAGHLRHGGVVEAVLGEELEGRRENLLALLAPVPLAEA
jgi:hypothetical protein